MSLISAEWQDAIADVAETLGLDPESISAPALPLADYVTLSAPTASTSASAMQVDGQDIPPPPPPFPGGEAASGETAAAEEPEPAKTGSKRTRGKGAAAAASKKAARTEAAPSANPSAANANRILTVLKEEDLRMPTLPTLEELEKFLVQKQKEEMLNEFV